MGALVLKQACVCRQNLCKYQTSVFIKLLQKEKNVFGDKNKASQKHKCKAEMQKWNYVYFEETLLILPNKHKSLKLHISINKTNMIFNQTCRPNIRFSINFFLSTDV